MTAAVVVDAAGAQMGGAARYLHELHGYLGRTGRSDVQSTRDVKAQFAMGSPGSRPGARLDQINHLT